MATAHSFSGFQFPTTTPVPDEVFDVLLPKLSGAELKVLLYICRRTLGFKKQSDNISLHQIATGITTKDGRVLDRGTGLCKAAVVTAVRNLEKKGIISKTRRQSVENGCEPTTYSLNFAPLSQQQTPLAKDQTGGCLKTKQGLVQNIDTQQTGGQETERQETDSVVVVTKQLETFGIAKACVTKLTQDYPEEYIREKVAMAKELVAAGSCLIAKNPAGWLRRAIEEDYTAPRQKKTKAHLAEAARQQREEREQQARLAAAAEEREAREEPRQQLHEEHPPQPIENTNLTTASAWSRALSSLQAQVPAPTYETWLKDTLLLSLEKSTAVIRVGSQLARQWLERRLYFGICRALRDVLQQDVEVQFVTA